MLNVDIDFLSDLYKLMHEEEGEKKYLLLEFVLARSELSSNLSLLDDPCRQTIVQTLPTLFILARNRSIYLRQVHVKLNTN
jgi:hypothetical protein